MKRRESNFELLRILAIVMVVIFHYVWNTDYHGSGTGRLVVDAFYLFGELGVNCFALLSGYFLSGAEHPFHAKKAVLLWFQVLFYSVVSAAVCYALKPEPVTLFSLCRIFLPIIFKNWWYITAYFLLYFITPYLNIVLRNLNRQEHQKLLAFLLTVFSIIPTVFGTLNNGAEKFLYYNRFLWLVVLYFAAAYIRSYDLTLFGRIRSWKGWLLLHALIWCADLLFAAFWERYGARFSEYFPIRATYFWNPNTIIVAGLSVTLFMTFKKIRIPHQPVIAYLGSVTFGIYLFHGGGSGSVWKAQLLHSAALSRPEQFFPALGYYLAAVLFFGTLFETGRKGLERIVLNKIIK